MNYRINTYDKNYVMVNISDVILLSEVENVSQTTFRYTYDIYLAWIKLLEENNNQPLTYEIALNRNNHLKKYLTKNTHQKTETDQHIYLYEEKEFKIIDLSSKVKIRKK